MLLAAHTAGSPYLDWYLGLAIGCAVVVVVVAVVALLLTFASRIGDHAMEATQAAGEARESTFRLEQLQATNEAADGVLEALRAVRRAVQGP